jgi:hypothetical protein
VCRDDVVVELEDVVEEVVSRGAGEVIEVLRSPRPILAGV